MADELILSITEQLQEKVYALRKALDATIHARYKKEKEYSEALGLLREAQDLDSPPKQITVHFGGLSDPDPNDATPKQIGEAINAAKSAFRVNLDAESLAATKHDIEVQHVETHRRVVRRVLKGAVWAAENGNVPALEWLQKLGFFGYDFWNGPDDVDVFCDWDVSD